MPKTNTKDPNGDRPNEEKSDFQFSAEFLQWYEPYQLTQICILDLYAAWCAGRVSLYAEMCEMNQPPGRIQ